jgi:isopentenyl diphosphate isomerase/L-lactate dehydrogenase-like FMN-dependent dehydrogenase
MVRTMKLLGVQSVSELDPSMVKYLRERLEG